MTTFPNNENIEQLRDELLQREDDGFLPKFGPGGVAVFVPRKEDECPPK